MSTAVAELAVVLLTSARDTRLGQVADLEATVAFRLGVTVAAMRARVQGLTDAEVQSLYRTCEQLVARSTAVAGVQS